MLKRIRELLAKRKKHTASASKAPQGTPSGAAAVADRPPVKRGPTVAHRPIPQADLDPDAVKIVRRLARFEYRAYLVGGCVRDLLLNRSPKDFDIGTSATPRQMKRLFRNCRIIGRRFRLAHIYFQHGKIIEVATFRARDVDEDEDTTGKDILIREDNVFGTPEEDALRRDFTINSLFYDVSEGNVIDHADGLADLRQRLVRTIGDPAIRFREDPVRILRAIKFAARLDFKIETQTASALSRTRKEIEKAAPPRVLEEIARYGREGASRRSYELLQETRVLDVILPELARGYAGSAQRWNLLLALFDYTDRERHGSKRPIRLGETFAVLFLPMLTERFGWKKDGTVDPPEGVDMRDLIDNTLRPMALRLRIPRREQEYCRQLLITLQRLVSTKNMRGGARRSIQSRDCYPDVLWMLGVVAASYKGSFTAVLEEWSGREPVSSPQESTEDRPSRRRRRRRGGRGRGSDTDEPAIAIESKAESKGDAKADAGRSGTSRRQAAAEKAKPVEGMPSPWDDSYFFAALPTLPEDGEKAPAAPGDGVSATPAAEQETQPAVEGDAPASAPKRRRRRRRRRKKPGESETAKPETGESGAEPPSDSGTEQEP